MKTRSHLDITSVNAKKNVASFMWDKRGPALLERERPIDCEGNQGRPLGEIGNMRGRTQYLKELEMGWLDTILKERDTKTNRYRNLKGNIRTSFPLLLWGIGGMSERAVGGYLTL